jgi:hypothetical protein
MVFSKSEKFQRERREKSKRREFSHGFREIRPICAIRVEAAPHNSQFVKR